MTPANCPTCHKQPSDPKFSEPHGLFLVFCCRYQAGAPSAAEAVETWNGLVKYNQDRKSSPAR